MMLLCHGYKPCDRAWGREGRGWSMLLCVYVLGGMHVSFMLLLLLFYYVYIMRRRILCRVRVYCWW